MKKFIPILGVLLLAISLVMLLAMACDYFNVYIPLVVNLIPKDRRPLPPNAIPSPEVSITTREKVIVIEPSPIPTLSATPEASPTIGPSATPGESTSLPAGEAH